MSASDAFNNRARPIPPQHPRVFLKAVREGRTRDVIHMLHDGFNPDARDAGGDTALHIACREGYEDIVEILLGAGADENAPNHKGETPIFHAMAQSNAEEMSIYIQGVIDNDRTAMLEAADVARERPHKEHRMVLALLGAGADLNARTVDGRTPLHHAIHEGKPLVARELILRGADPGIKNRDGLKPLSRRNAHNAIAEGEHMSNLRGMAEAVRGSRKLHKLKRHIRPPQH